MANEYLEIIAAQLGMSVWLLAIILIWGLVWKLLALWKSARKNDLVWFILIAVLNTVGVLPILYIFVFSKLKHKPVAKKKTRKTKSARKRKRE